jgi:hypothetical protein
MAATITHNIDAVIKRLNTFQRVDLPRATRRTMSNLGYTLAKRDVPGYMEAVFDRPNRFTLSSLSYKVVSPYEVQLSFRQNVPKGNDPARYLQPVLKEGGGGKKPAYSTKFTRFVHSSGAASRSEYPVPVKENLSKNSYGKVSQGEYSKAWSGLTSSLARSRKKSDLDPSLSFGGQKRRLAGFNRNNNFRYFSKNNSGQIFMGGAIQRPPSKGSLFDTVKPGIYRIKSNNLQLLFTYARQQPRVPQIFDYYGFVSKHVAAYVPRELARHLT